MEKSTWLTFSLWHPHIVLDGSELHGEECLDQKKLKIKIIIIQNTKWKHMKKQNKMENSKKKQKNNTLQEK